MSEHSNFLINIFIKNAQVKKLLCVNVFIKRAHATGTGLMVFSEGRPRQKNRPYGLWTSYDLLSFLKPGI